jgi:hypothetical protein
MPVETPSIFARVIQDHLELKERNSGLEHAMPLGRYKVEDPFHNHPLFKTEEQARIEDTLDGAVAVPVAAITALEWPSDETEERTATELDSGLWSRSRDFDWGD